MNTASYLHVSISIISVCVQLGEKYHFIVECQTDRPYKLICHLLIGGNHQCPNLLNYMIVAKLL